MKDQSNPENLFKNQILNPKSQGERDVVNFHSMDHIDEICDIQKVLLVSNQFISLQKSDSSFDETPDWSGYIKLY